MYFDWNFTEFGFPKGPIDNNPALVQVIAWHQIGDKPLSEPMLTPFTDAYAALGGDYISSKYPWNPSIDKL